MYKLVIALGLVVTISACESKDKQFCDCISISKEFNELTQKRLAGNLSEEELTKAKELQAQKDSVCEPYEMMGGQEMLKKKAACGFKDEE